ncbi:hypothetical protein PRIPAC_70876 [Pristionchus pacificus]|uniref:Uncharacterized protein n=1 Tax=Pristionchus pacificus TaxID=54126 RepID=A0A454XKF9_PRIPA|nr:hypothetical protein PRIPAC_70876 [Pristionchus pacificus]|eukprot:PDM64853.1 hypothetical protein PRIPAC_53109 [Pristionchus pacificus]
MEEGSTSSTSFTPIPSLMQASQLPAKPPALTIQIVSPQSSPLPSLPPTECCCDERLTMSPLAKYSIPYPSSPLPNSPYFFTGPAAYSSSSPINVFHFLLSLITFTLLCVCYIVFFLI